MRPLLILGWLACSACVAQCPVVVAGRPVATIVVATGAPAERTVTAQLLQDYVRQSTGATLPIAPEAATGTALLLGRSARVEQLGLHLEQLDDDGFVLQAVDARTYVIAGPTEWGTEFGVTEFLERFVGVRWLLPGDAGTDVPRLTDLALPAGTVRQTPAIFSRLLSGLQGPAQGDWARRNRMHGRVSFHHNLLHLFPPSKYVATHPEFFPQLKGQRYLPQKDDDHAWQPNFSAPGIVEEAARNICEEFRTHPAATSYSLGMNDSIAFDESPASLARESGRRNFLGLRDVSDSYYQWCNDVVALVLQQYPDKWFGLLAYNNVAEPPTKVKLNPRIIPYLTYDRMKWIRPELRAYGEELTRRWQAQSPTVGWYDYVYGSPYCVPRVYPHQMATYLRFGRDHGVRAHYAEIYPNWGEGPKPYIYLKLQWNPDADVDALLDDWYQRCVGPAAAPRLKEYYALWEQFWTRDAPHSAWWTDGGQYLNFGSPAYLLDVKEATIRRSRELLDECLKLADTPARQARAGLLRDAFGYYEASALAYRAEDLARTTKVDSEQSALKLLDQAVERIELAGRRREMVTAWAKHPVLRQPLDLDTYPALSGASWGAGLLFKVYDQARLHPAVRRKVEALAQSPSALVRQQAEGLLAVLGGTGRLLSANPSVEDDLRPWSPWTTTGTMKRSDTVAHTGRWSILSEGEKRGGPNQILPLTPGRYLAICMVYIPAGQKSRGTVAIAAVPRSDDNANLPCPQTQVVPVPGEWVTAACVSTVPATLRGVKVTKALLVAIIDGFQPGEQVYLDDLALYRLPD